MKTPVFLTLLLSTLFALPGSAQQTNPKSGGQPAASGDQTAPASQNVGTTGKESPAPMNSGDFWEGDEPNLAHLLAHPLATKKYVQRQTQAIRDSLNELDELTKSNSKNLKDVDARAQQGIRLASSKTTEADQHATEASNRAQTAQLTANQASTRLATIEQVVGNIDQYKASTQTEIRFRPGQSVLSKQAKDALDNISGSLKDQRSYVIEVQGFAPGNGQVAIATSKKLADSVVRYLVLAHGIPAYRIYAVGMGNAPVAAEERTTARVTGGGWVEVSLLKNDLVSSVQH